MNQRAFRACFTILSLLLFAFSCGDDDDDSGPSDDDDNADDDDDDNDDNDAADDDDDDDEDDDDNNDDDAVDYPWMMRPADLDGQPGEEILLWRVYNDVGVNKAEFTLVGVDGAEIYTHPAVDVGANGTAQYRVVDFDGAPPAEIVITYQRINASRAGVQYEGWAEVLRGPGFDPILYLPPVANAVVWLGVDFDLNRDGRPDLTAETRPIDVMTAGGLEVIDVVNNETLLTVDCGPGESAVIAGRPGDGYFEAPAPISERTGEYFLLSRATVAGDGHVAVYLRNAEDPEAEGELLDEAELAVVSSYDVQLCDHDGNGRFDPFLFFHEETGHRYEYRNLYNGNLEECASLSPRFVRDLDGDGLSDLVFAGSQCSQVKSGNAAVIYVLSTDPYNPVYQWTQGDGKLSPFFYNAMGNLAGAAQIDGAPGEEFGIFAVDESAATRMGIDLYSPENLFEPIWTSSELSPAGQPQSGGARIADFTGDGRLDIAAYAVAVITDKVFFFNTEFYLFEGPELTDRSPFHKPGEYWTLGGLWDFDGDNAPEMLLQRFLSGSAISPRIILASPADDFQVLYEYADTDAESMGLVGMYKNPQE